MKNREEILNRIYKACFLYPNLKEKLFEDWKWVAETMEGGDEDRISVEVLHYVDLWLDVEFDLTF